MKKALSWAVTEPWQLTCTDAWCLTPLHYKNSTLNEYGQLPSGELCWEMSAESALTFNSEWIHGVIRRVVTYTTYKTIHSAFHFHQNSFDGNNPYSFDGLFSKMNIVHIYCENYLILCSHFSVHADIYQVREGRPTRSCHGGPKGPKFRCYKRSTPKSEHGSLSFVHNYCENSLILCSHLSVHADIYQVREGRLTRSCHGGPKGPKFRCYE